MNMHTLFRLNALGMAVVVLALSGCSTLDKLHGGKSANSNAATAAGPLPPAMANNALEINHEDDRGCAPAALATLAARLLESSQQAAFTQTVLLFGTDKHEVNADAATVLAAHSALLQQQDNLRLKITGHTDERGTADYNLALGERRANTVATFLAAAGVKPAQLQVVSYGEEKPVAAGADEAAWAQNRRVELTYSGCAQ